MKFIVTGGGTGGHIYPALAIAGGLRERFGAEVVYIGGTRGLESEIVPREGLPFEAIPLAGIRRGLHPANFTAVWKAAAGIGRAYSLIKRIKPSAVIGTGGYVCGPAVLAAAISGVPTLIHEQNAFPGITNRVLSRFAGCVALTFEEARKYLPARARIRVTGLPIRKEIFSRDRDKARKDLGVPPDALFILSFGGSQGARSINSAMAHVLKYYAGNERVYILHVTGPANYQAFMDGAGIKMAQVGNITITSYMHDMPGALAASDIAVCRAGAATLAELTAVGLPAILVPYPYSAENHQEYNARALEKKGAALVVRDRDLTGDFLTAQIERFIGQRKLLEDMSSASRGMGRPDALEDILDCLHHLINN